jgi:hypothetical protein
MFLSGKVPEFRSASGDNSSDRRMHGDSHFLLKAFAGRYYAAWDYMFLIVLPGMGHQIIDDNFWQ